MVFEDRVAKYPGRWTMVKSDGTSEIVTLVRNDEPTNEGTPINAATLNELSTVAGAINAKEEAVLAASTAQTASTSAGKSAQAASADAQKAESSAASAKASADKAATIVSTDKTLTVESAPADAKATGDALNARYTKEEVDALLQNVNPFPVGSIYQSTNPTSPAALFGGTWEQIASERVLMGASSTHAAGSTVEAGLPNIEGRTTTVPMATNAQAGPWFTGAFSRYDPKSIPSNPNPVRPISGEGTPYIELRYSYFDASLSNAIYGASDTVQPAAYYVYIWHRVA